MRTEDPSNGGPLDLPEGAISDADFVRAFDVATADCLNIDTRNNGADLAGLSDHLNREIEAARRIHDHTRDAIRDVIFPRLKESPFASSSVGLFRATAEEIEKAARTLFFAGGVAAVDGTSTVIDMLPLTIIQISTSYNGQRREYGHRMFISTSSIIGHTASKPLDYGTPNASRT